MTVLDVPSTEVEPVEGPTVASLAPARQEQAGSLVRPAAELEQIVGAFHAYQELSSRLLTGSDFQNISGKQFKKKSAWRKLAVAFGVSFSIKERVYERNEAGRIVRAEFIVVATAPNGRFSEGFGAADLFEKCCQPGCTKGGRHKHCAANCPGSIHFSNPQHDLPATAETRAKNRAASDLFGMGEVSAEEMAHYEEGYWGGWVTEEELKAAHDPIVDAVKAASAEVRQAAKAWRDERGLKLPMPKDDFAEYETFVAALLAAASQEPPTEGDGADGAPTEGMTGPAAAAVPEEVPAQTTPAGDAPEPTPASGSTPTAGGTSAAAPPPARRVARATKADTDAEEAKAKVARQALWAACRGAGIKDDSPSLRTLVLYVSKGRTTSRSDLAATECETAQQLLYELEQGYWRWGSAEDGTPLMIDAQTGEAMQ